MKTFRYRLIFSTPAFLGNASQQGQWRTPPVKALLRQWWRVAVALLGDLRQFLAHEDDSRRAARRTRQWPDAQILPTSVGGASMRQSLLTYPFERHAQEAAKAQAAPLVQRLAALTLAQSANKRISWLRNFISVAEFLASEVRSTAAQDA